MPTKVQQYAEMADCAVVHITSSIQNWIAFLKTSGRMYKYRFDDQLMIHIQRPRATACAEYNVWNKRLHRYVQRGAKGIALLRRRNDKTTLSYVFDVADTGRTRNSAPVYLWEYNEAYQEAVTTRLEEVFGIPGEKGLAEQLIRISLQLADTYWYDNKHTIVNSVEGSLLEELDELNIGIEFCRAAAVSIAFTVLSRCSQKMKGFFEKEDFQYVYDFNSKGAATVLGTAVKECSEMVLRLVEQAIKAERMGERPRKAVKAPEFPQLSKRAEAPEPAETSEEAESAQEASSASFPVQDRKSVV